MKVPSLEMLSALPKNVSINLDDCHIIAQTQDRPDYKATIAEKNGCFYIFEDNRRYIASEKEMYYLLAPEEQIYGKSVRSLYFDENSKNYFYTPDNKHIYQIKTRLNSNICELPVAFYLNPNQITLYDSCKYKGITLTYLQSDVAIEKDGVCRVMPVKDDANHLYKIYKREIRARDGAAGFYSFFENITEQAKIERPSFETYFTDLEYLLQDPHNPGYQIGNPNKEMILPYDAYTLGVATRNNALLFEGYETLEQARNDGDMIITRGHKGYAVRYDYTNQIVAERGQFPVIRLKMPDEYEVKLFINGKIKNDIVRTEMNSIRDRLKNIITEECTGYAVFNKTSKVIEEIAGDFPVEKAFAKNILILNGLFDENKADGTKDTENKRPEYKQEQGQIREG